MGSGASRSVGFLIAMPTEAKPLIKRLGLTKGSVGGEPIWTGSLGDRPVRLVVSGMGTELATAGTTRLLDAAGPEVTHVVVVGITGGVDNDTPIGTLIRPATVIDAASGTEYRPHPLLDGEAEGSLWTTDVMTPPDEVARLRGQGVVGLDMETAAVAAVCEDRGVPWSVVRVISDRPDDEVDEEILQLSNQDGTPNLGNVVRYVLRHPSRIPGLARMGQGLKLATTRAVDTAVAALAAQD